MDTMRLSRFGTGLLVAAVCASGTAAVQYRYDVTPPTVDLTAGQTYTFTIKLVETSDTLGESLLVNEAGLFGFDVRVSRLSGNSVMTNAALNTAAFTTVLGTTYSPTRPFAASGISTLDMTLSSLDEQGPAGTASSDGLVRELVLATVTAKAVDTTIFTIEDSPVGTNTLTNFGTPLDSQIQSTSFQIAVPEPGTVGLALGVIGLALAPRKRAPIQRD